MFSLSFKVTPISLSHPPISLYLVRVGTAPISIGYLFVNLCSDSVFGVAPILIGHFHIISVFRTAPISIGHSFCQFNFQDYTYIDHSFPCQLSFEGCTYIDRLSSMSV